MKFQKIRGHNRRHKAIEHWRLENLELRLDLLEEFGYQYTKIRIRPWSGLSLIGSIVPEPRRKTKLLMLNGLVDIYNSWKTRLEKFGQPYYLKIWLFEPRFSESQVVCAVGERIDYYANLSLEADDVRELRTGNYGYLKSKLGNLNWELRIDEDHIDDDAVGEPELYSKYRDYIETKKWFNKLMKKPHRTRKYSDGAEFYSFAKGDVWLGGID